ncbi:MAG: hypothetical protein COA97_04630 [Flavobacteriales bacterium]|nr:MAG: hypothetical protein COA97_04630 [Flavobacteriales bacterium]
MDNKVIIQELTERFDFLELTEDHKEMVLLEMSELEYDHLRETIKMTVNYFENEPQLLADNSLKPVIEKDNVLLRIINYKIPTYKVAAAIVLMVSFNFIASKMLNNDAVEIVENESIVPEESSFEEFQKYSSNNSIKYNRGFARLY